MTRLRCRLCPDSSQWWAIQDLNQWPLEWEATTKFADLGSGQVALLPTHPVINAIGNLACLHQYSHHCITRIAFSPDKKTTAGAMQMRRSLFVNFSMECGRIECAHNCP
jgi:hypothetical protein